MATPQLNPSSRALVVAFLSRRGLMKSAAAAGVILGFGFRKTPEIEAQQLTGDSLYDQLGGLVGIAGVVTTFVGNVAADDRINGFFASANIPRLQELLIQQIAEATGGPVRYTGLDMKTAHRGMGISTADFTALVEDLVMALDANGVAEGPKNTLLGALAPLASDIVERP